MCTVPQKPPLRFHSVEGCREVNLGPNRCWAGIDSNKSGWPLGFITTLTPRWISWTTFLVEVSGHKLESSQSRIFVWFSNFNFPFKKMLLMNRLFFLFLGFWIAWIKRLESFVKLMSKNSISGNCLLMFFMSRVVETGEQWAPHSSAAHLPVILSSNFIQSVWEHIYKIYDFVYILMYLFINHQCHLLLLYIKHKCSIHIGWRSYSIMRNLKLLAAHRWLVMSS